MTDESRYHVRRGQRERIVDVVGGSRPPPARMADGSNSAMRPPPLSEDLGELVPPPDVVPVRFGDQAVVIEHQGERVTLVLPGAIRVVGTVEDARRLAAALLRGS